MRLTASTIMRACAYLEAGEPEHVLLALEDAEDGVMARGLRLAAGGLLHEREGRLPEAAASFEGACSLGVPLPALLHECARYFVRAGAYERAHHSFALLEQIRPGSIDEFLAALPAREVARYAPWRVRRLSAQSRPHHWFYPPVKSALCRAMGVEGASVAFTRMAGNDVGSVRAARLTSLDAFAASRALFHEEVSPSRDVHMPSPRVVGASPGDGVSGRMRRWFVTILGDAVVSSKSNLLVADSIALLDYQERELDKVPVDLSTDPIVFGDEGEVAADGKWIDVCIEGHASPSRAIDEALTLVGVNTYNYGHWLLEFLPKVWICTARRNFSGVPVLIDEQMPPQHIEALRLFAGPRHPIVVLRRGEAALVRKLWACSTVTYVPLAPLWGSTAAPDLMVCDGARLASLIETARPLLDTVVPVDGPRRIYLTRSDSQHRRLVNRREVESWFGDRGFTVVNPGELTFAEQVRLVSGAEVIVGQDGSSFMNTFFARRGARIGVLAPPFLEDNEWYVDLSHALGHRLLYATGEVVEADENLRFRAAYRIAIDGLRDFVRELLAP